MEGIDAERGILDLHLQNLDEGILVRIGDGDGKSAGETRDKSIRKIFQFARRAVTGQDNLLGVADKKVEDIEEHGLASFLLGQKLNVIDQEKIDGGKEILQAFGFLISQGELDEFGDEVVARDIENLAGRILHLVGIADGLKKMRLSQAGFGIEKNRIASGWILDGKKTGKIGVSVIGSDDEILEQKLLLEIGILEEGRGGLFDQFRTLAVASSIGDVDAGIAFENIGHVLCQDRKKRGLDEGGCRCRVGDEGHFVVLDGLQFEIIRGSEERVEQCRIDIFLEALH